jgi:proline dehydrogenase
MMPGRTLPRVSDYAGPGAWTHEPSPRQRRFSAAAALRHGLLWASRRQTIKGAITYAPATRALVRRFVAGEGTEDAVAVTRELAAHGAAISLDHLGEDTRDVATAQDAVTAYVSLIRRLADEGLTATAEVSVKLSALGQTFDPPMALDNARAICEAACTASTSVTIDMEDHTTTDATLLLVAQLRRDFPSTGAVIQASLRRSESDCQTLASVGSRVRLCKGAYQEPAAVAWQRGEDVRSAYLACLRTLMQGGAYVMVATHDPKLITAAARFFDALAPDAGHEYQMLYGVRPDEQSRLVGDGEKLRVYVPFGTQWYSYLMRRMAERPANLALALRAVVSRA